MINFVHALSTFAKTSLKPVLVSVMMFVNLFFIRAQEGPLRIYYRFDSASLDAAYLSNNQTLNLIDNAFANGVDGALEIVSYSSPEGNAAYNKFLSARRAEALRRYIVSKYPQLAGKVSVNPHAECWDGLRSIVSSDVRLSDAAKQSILSVIDSDDEADAKEAALKALPAYKALYSNYFRRLRYAEIHFVAASPAESNPAAQISGSQPSASVSASGKANSVHFPLRGDAIDAGFNGNAAALQAVANALEGRTAAEISTIHITSIASPEGPQAVNDR